MPRQYYEPRYCTKCDKKLKPNSSTYETGVCHECKLKEDLKAARFCVECGARLRETFQTHKLGVCNNCLNTNPKYIEHRRAYGRLRTQRHNMNKRLRQQAETQPEDPVLQ